MDKVTVARGGITLIESKSPISNYITSLGIPTDVNILCGTTVFRAHRTLLGTSSNYLLELFIKQPNGLFHFILDEIEPLDVENLLTYIYQAKVSVTKPQAKGFLRAATQLKIDALMEDACKTLAPADDGCNASKPILRTDMNLDQNGNKPIVQMPKQQKIPVKVPEVEKTGENFKAPLPKGSKKPKHHHLAEKPEAPHQQLEEMESDDSYIEPQPVINDPPAAQKKPKGVVKILPVPLIIPDNPIPSAEAPFKAFKAPWPKTRKGEKDERLANTKINETKCSQPDSKKTTQIPPELSSLREIIRKKFQETEENSDSDFIHSKKPQKKKGIKTDDKPKPLEVEPPLNIRGILGRPILSSTKLESSNAIIPDKLIQGGKPFPLSQDENTPRYFETPDTDETKAGKTFVVPPKLAKGTKRRVLGQVQPQAQQLPPFCVTDMVKEIEKKNEQKSVIVEDDVIKHKSKKDQKKPMVVKKVKKTPLKRLKKKAPLNPMSNSEENKSKSYRRVNRKAETPIIKNIIRPTDESSGPKVIGEIRKKIPVAKRRRVPASTRPVIDSSATTTTSMSVRRSVRNQLVTHRMPASDF